jgi:hypothetical protein
MYDHWGLINLGCCMLLHLAVLTILFSAAIFCYHKTVLESTAILKRESKLVTLLALKRILFKERLNKS